MSHQTTPYLNRLAMPRLTQPYLTLTASLYQTGPYRAAPHLASPCLTLTASPYQTLPRRTTPSPT